MSAWLRLEAEAIPAALRAVPYVLWRAEPRDDDKPAKVPYQIAEPWRRASSTRAATWGTFEDAVRVYRRLVTEPADPEIGPIVGIGCVLTREAGITCLDLDRVVAADGTLDPRAETIVERCTSWTEISPSGTGLHVFVTGTVSRPLKGHQVEMYAERRYICVTGHPWPGTPATLTPQQPYLDWLVAQADADEPRPVAAALGGAAGAAGGGARSPGAASAAGADGAGGPGAGADVGEHGAQRRLVVSGGRGRPPADARVHAARG